MSPRTPDADPGRHEPPGDDIAQVQVIAGAMAAAVVVYAAVAWLVVEQLGGEVLAGGMPAPVPGVLVAVAATMLLAAPVVERRVLARPPRPPRAEPLPADRGERYRLAKLVGFALREAAAVVGLVVGLTTGEPRWTWTICAGTLILMALAWPRAEHLRADHGAGPGGVEPR